LLFLQAEAYILAVWHQGSLVSPISGIYGHILTKLSQLPVLVTRSTWHWWHFQCRKRL